MAQSPPLLPFLRGVGGGTRVRSFVTPYSLLKGDARGSETQVKAIFIKGFRLKLSPIDSAVSLQPSVVFHPIENCYITNPQSDRSFSSSLKERSLNRNRTRFSSIPARFPNLPGCESPKPSPPNQPSQYLDQLVNVDSSPHPIVNP